MTHAAMARRLLVSDGCAVIRKVVPQRLAEDAIALFFNTHSQEERLNHLQSLCKSHGFRLIGINDRVRATLLKSGGDIPG